MNTLPPGTPVNHKTFLRGVVEFCKGATTLVRFSHGIEECETAELSILRSAEADYLEGRLAPAQDVVFQMLGESIVSVNNTWGVFSPSRIDLYPHQLWVCKKVTEQWPARWVIADDVGLGKTIEAGMILWRLFHLGLVKRLLILCPASLVGQWQKRLYEMFDIRVAEYMSTQDTNRVDFWKMNDYVVASFQTLRDDRKDRHERMLNAPAWDLVLVDEAHHLNFDEATGMTLGHRLVKKLQDASQFQSLLLFTGTPHRGKHFGFLALMSLVRPDLFDPRKPAERQMVDLPQALIRNNKYCVTDLRGARMFREPEVITATYHYCPEEQHFYTMMTEFIASGRAYATSLSGQQGRAVMLVLTALQKLASSSVLAVRRALEKRLEKMRGIEAALRKSPPSDPLFQIGDDSVDADESDQLNRLTEDQISIRALELMNGECARLEELISAADKVQVETKMAAILDVVRRLPSTEPVLFFTEYKATQALLISALWAEFGEGCVSFINGDEALPAVLRVDGSSAQMRETKIAAAEKFNDGDVRFLVSTEAGGEGIDLQERCSRLVHVDVPWNPMRLHQRVGRLNRIGQKDLVKVMLFQNPDTVEARIWALLSDKLERISVSINAVTEQREDLKQLVLGIAGPGIIESIFSGASFIEPGSLSKWFDTQTGQIGGEDVVKAVHDLLGHAQQFDFAQVSGTVPKLDLPALEPFFRLALRYNHRQVTEKEGRLSFKTPEEWNKHAGIKARYEGIHFVRKVKGKDKGHVLGIGMKVFDCALNQAQGMAASCASLPKGSLSGTLCVYRCFDRITGDPAKPSGIVCSVLLEDGSARLLRDSETMELLNQLVPTLKGWNDLEGHFREGPGGDPELLKRARSIVEEKLSDLGLPFRQPDLELTGILCSTDSQE